MMKNTQVCKHDTCLTVGLPFWGKRKNEPKSEKRGGTTTIIYSIFGQKPAYYRPLARGHSKA